jgi:hypothetical protein
MFEDKITNYEAASLGTSITTHERIKCVPHTILIVRPALHSHPLSCVTFSHNIFSISLLQVTATHYFLNVN